MITQFWDMYSGGDQKLEWEQIFIEANEADARRLFEDVFGRDPDHVTCSCCGEDYSVHEYENLAQATAFHRNCAFDKVTGEWIDAPSGVGEYMTVEEYGKQPDVLYFLKADQAQLPESTK